MDYCTRSISSWSQLASLISSAAVLSLSIGPVALVVLRAQAPDYQRPFRVPFGTPFAGRAFVFVGFIVYWSGWNTNWKVLLIALIGMVYFFWRRAVRDDDEPSYFLNSVWLIIYFASLLVMFDAFLCLRAKQKREVGDFEFFPDYKDFFG